MFNQTLRTHLSDTEKQLPGLLNAFSVAAVDFLKALKSHSCCNMHRGPFKSVSRMSVSQEIQEIITYTL